MAIIVLNVTPGASVELVVDGDHTVKLVASKDPQATPAWSQAASDNK